MSRKREPIFRRNKRKLYKYIKWTAAGIGIVAALYCTAMAITVGTDAESISRHILSCITGNGIILLSSMAYDAAKRAEIRNRNIFAKK